MNYCMECGTRLTEKYLDKENSMIPYCENCQEYHFPIFNSAVSMVVYDVVNKKYLLIKQYGKPYYRLVAGYINRGEAAEDAVLRELMEETSLSVKSIVFNESSFFEPSNTLMHNFVCYIDDSNTFCANEEIDSWSWFDEEEALAQIKPGSLAQKFLQSYINKLSN